MRCDMVVAVGTATADRRTLFGHTCTLPLHQPITLVRACGREFALGETVRTQYRDLPQGRHTCTVLGAQPQGCWGYVHGVNEHGLALGFTPLGPKLDGHRPGLTGPDLVRLALERCQSARQALDLLTDLLQRDGRAAASAEDEHDPAFLVADAHEAFAVESAGGYWAEQEVCAVRAVSGVRVIRQDWDRIARGLAGVVIERGWWPADGTKLDFAGVLGEERSAAAPTWRRWGRATLLLERQNGLLDAAYLRAALADHDDKPADAAGPTSLCQHATLRQREETAACLVASLDAGPGHVSAVWFAFGPPCAGLWFPIFLAGDLPPELAATGPTSVASRLRRLQELVQEIPARRGPVVTELARLQARFQQEAEEFAQDAATLRARGEAADLPRLAGAFMQHTVERFEAAASLLLPASAPAALSEW